MTIQDEPKLSEGVGTEKLLVEIVQGLLMAHARIDQLDGSLRLAVNSRANDIQAILTSDVTVAAQRHSYLAGQSTKLLDGQKALTNTIAIESNRQTNAAQAEGNKQNENWKNLNLFLKDWQARQGKANTENIAAVHNETLTINEKLKAVEARVQGTTTQVANTNRRLLIWLIVLSAISVVLLGIMTYKTFVH